MENEGLHMVRLLLDSEELPRTVHELARVLFSWVDGPLPAEKTEHEGPYKTYDGQLVIDARRGVIYFHDETGVTLLRVNQLDLQRAAEMERPFIDVTFSHVSIQEQP